MNIRLSVMLYSHRDQLSSSFWPKSFGCRSDTFGWFSHSFRCLSDALRCSQILWNTLRCLSVSFRYFPMPSDRIWCFRAKFRSPLFYPSTAISEFEDSLRKFRTLSHFIRIPDESFTAERIWEDSKRALLVDPKKTLPYETARSAKARAFGILLLFRCLCAIVHQLARCHKVSMREWESEKITLNSNLIWWAA